MTNSFWSAPLPNNLLSYASLKYNQNFAMSLCQFGSGSFMSFYYMTYSKLVQFLRFYQLKEVLECFHGTSNFLKNEKLTVSFFTKVSHIIIYIYGGEYFCLTVLR